MITNLLSGKTSVDSIMASFNKTINDLSSLTASKNEEAQGITQKISTLEQQRVAAEAEASKATTIAQKLRQLID